LKTCNLLHLTSGLDLLHFGMDPDPWIRVHLITDPDSDPAPDPDPALLVHDFQEVLLHNVPAHNVNVT
jgi:hypothetical protein